MKTRVWVESRDGKLYVRCDYGVNGKRKQLTRRAKSQDEADAILQQLQREYQQAPMPRGVAHAVASQPIGIERQPSITFLQLAVLYRKTKLIPARYIGEKKVLGMRNPIPAGCFVNQLERWFAEKPIAEITPFDLSEFRLHLMNTETMHGTQRSMAAVNRCLEQLRGMFRFAVKAQLLARNPFDHAFEPLIVTSAENHRDRVLSFDEEKRLLTACNGGEQSFKRSHLRPLVIAALDTAARKNELMTLEWRDIDLDAGLIQVRAINAKTGKARILPVTPRLREVLTMLLPGEQAPHQRVFDCSSDIRKAFATACRIAGIDDLRFHDLRHTAITRMVESGIPASLIMKVSGHSQMSTFLRYTNTNNDSLKAIGEQLAQFLASKNSLTIPQSTSDD